MLFACCSHFLFEDRPVAHAFAVSTAHLACPKLSPVLVPGDLVLGPWSLVPGPWSLVHGAWSLVPGPWSLCLDPWSLHGPGPIRLGYVIDAPVTATTTTAVDTATTRATATVVDTAMTCTKRARHRYHYNGG